LLQKSFVIVRQTWAIVSLLIVTVNFKIISFPHTQCYVHYVTFFPTELSGGLLTISEIKRTVCWTHWMLLNKKCCKANWVTLQVVTPSQVVVHLGWRCHQDHQNQSHVQGQWARKGQINYTGKIQEYFLLIELVFEAQLSLDWNLSNVFWNVWRTVLGQNQSLWGFIPNLDIFF